MPRQVYTLLAIVLLTVLLRILTNSIDKKRAKKRAMKVFHDDLEKLKLELNIPPDYEDEIKADAMLKRYDKEAKRISRQFKHSDIKTHNIDGEIISYAVYADAEFLPWWATLYFRGNTYQLDLNAEGSYYFTDDTRTPAKVIETIKPLLPEISRTITMFNLYEHPKHEFWNLDTLSGLDAEYAVHGVASTLLDLVFFQWYFYTERNTLDPTFPLYYLTNIVQHPESDLVEIYPDNALYQFIMGWMMATDPFFFRLSPEHHMGEDMMLEAHRLEPTNPLYKWGVSKQLNLTREETRALAAQVQRSQFDDLLEPFIGDYFMEILQGDVQV